MRGFSKNFTQRTYRAQRNVRKRFTMRALRLAGNGPLATLRIYWLTNWLTTVFGYGQLSLASLRGRLIEYQLRLG